MFSTKQPTITFGTHSSTNSSNHNLNQGEHAVEHHLKEDLQHVDAGITAGGVTGAGDP